MMKRLLTLLATSLCFLAPISHADEVEVLAHDTATTGTVTVGRQLQSIDRNTKSHLWKYTFDWTSGTDTVDCPIPAIVGIIRQVTTNPGDGDAQPDDDYDVTLLDSEGFDVYAAAGVNRDETTNQGFAPFLSTYGPTVLTGTSRLYLTDTGAATTGKVTMIVEVK